MTSQTEERQKLFEMISEMEVAMLATRLEDGSLRSRPMATRIVDGDEHLWFLTDRDSAKVYEVSNHGQVNVSYSDPGEGRYVSVSGNAAMYSDADTIEKVWTPAARVWFPDGKSDRRIAVIRVQPTMAEYWDAPQGAFVNLYHLAKSVTMGERPTDVGENEKVQM